MEHLSLQTEAPLRANVTLLAETAMGIALLFGWRLARHGKYRAHAWCQSAVVLLNLVVIVLAMAASLLNKVLPKIPSRLGRPFYAIALAHGMVGAIAELMGLYVLLAAGTTMLPERWRLRDFKKTMRMVLALWWAALLLGLATYARWYVRV